MVIGWARGARFTVIAAGLLLVAALTGCQESIPTDPVERAIYDRKKNFESMGQQFKVIDDQIKSGNPDYARVTEAAEGLHAVGKELITWFPNGTGPESGFETDAKPKIWEEFNAFEAAHDDFVTEAGRLVEASRLNDLAALTSQYHTTGASCANCHKPYRVKR